MIYDIDETDTNTKYNKSINGRKKTTYYVNVDNLIKLNIIKIINGVGRVLRTTKSFRLL